MAVKIPEQRIPPAPEGKKPLVKNLQQAAQTFADALEGGLEGGKERDVFARDSGFPLDSITETNPGSISPISRMFSKGLSKEGRLGLEVLIRAAAIAMPETKSSKDSKGPGTKSEV